MTRRLLSFQGWLVAAAALRLAGGVALAQPVAGAVPVQISTVNELRQLVRQEGRVVCAFSLSGIVTATNSPPRSLVFQDSSGAVQMALSTGLENICPGQQVRITAENCLVTWRRDTLEIGSQEAIVDNDGKHESLEKSGDVFINGNICPLRVGWFNSLHSLTLEIGYEGADFARRKIPDAALFFSGSQLAADTNSGLDYRCFEGDWQNLPDFGKLTPVKTGRVTNFDLAVRSRDELVGLEFSGSIQLPHPGRYRFFLKSDDGSQLFLGGGLVRCEVIKSGDWPPPKPIAAGQALSDDNEFQWAEVAGFVRSVAHDSQNLYINMGAESSRMTMIVPGGSAINPEFLLNSRLRVRGVVQSVINSSGERIAGRLMVPGEGHITLLQIPADVWQKYPVSNFSNVVGLATTNSITTPVHLMGIARPLESSNGFFLVDEMTNHIEVRSSFAVSVADGEKMEVLGFPDWHGTNFVLIKSICRPQALALAGDKDLPVLTTIDEVRELKPEEAQKRYPVKVRGVVTFAEHQRWGSLHNGVNGINVLNINAGSLEPAQVGEYCEIQGETRQFGFGPMIACTNRVVLGNGMMPEPLHPTFEQLINGSLDGQWVEIEGGVLQQSADGEGTTLLAGMSGGSVPIFLPHNLQDPAQVASYRDCLVRATGVVMPTFNAQRQIESVRIFISSTRFLNVIEAAAADPFSGVARHVRELLYFDPRAVSARRVKVFGQVVHVGGDTCFLMDGNDGLRFIPKEQNRDFRVGDLVEVLGYPELGNHSGAPLLREALVRKLSQAGMPAPRSLAATNFLDAGNDATLVRVTARLVNAAVNHGELVIEFQSGPRTGTARLVGEAPPLPPVGSLIQLTGVYAGQGGSRVFGRTFDSFELLLNSPVDFVVLARPPWWNFRMTMVVVGILSAIVALAVVWITVLRRQVEERTAQLASQMHERQRAEQQRALEHERARVAQDLHDELGAGLTEVGILGALVKNPDVAAEKKSGYLDQVIEVTSGLVTALDEIVWAVNPRYDSVGALRGYFSLYAQRLLDIGSIRCFLGMPADLPEHPLDSKTRHSLFLAFKEALNNIVKHAQATEVHLTMRVENDELLMTIADNGLGLNSETDGAGGDGLRNMQERLRHLGGQCQIRGVSGQGTTVTFRLPLCAAGTKRVMSPQERLPK